MYESRTSSPISSLHFAYRMLLHGLALALLLLGSLTIGMAGYMHYEQLAWRDAFLDSAMLLGGMGPVHPPQTDAGKLFAGCYALYAGLVFIIGVSIVLGPSLHRMLHLFHWDDASGTDRSDAGGSDSGRSDAGEA